MSNHTPGPWNTILSGASEYAGMVETECNVQSEYTNVATVHAGIGYAEFVANARLIAAAPELLRACEVALEQMPTDTTDQRCVIGQIQEAIRKATRGEGPIYPS